MPIYKIQCDAKQFLSRQFNHYIMYIPNYNIIFNYIIDGLNSFTVLQCEKKVLNNNFILNLQLFIADF